jgi:hypothetical protein
MEHTTYIPTVPRRTASANEVGTLNSRVISTSTSIKSAPLLKDDKHFKAKSLLERLKNVEYQHLLCEQVMRQFTSGVGVMAD